MVETADAAVEKVVVVIAPDNAAFTNVAVKGSSWDILPAACAAVSVTGLRLVIRFRAFLV